jgi:hypothetical protein
VADGRGFEGVGAAILSDMLAVVEGSMWDCWVECGGDGCSDD